MPKIVEKGHIANESSWDPKCILCEQREELDNRHFAGITKCKKFKKNELNSNKLNHCRVKQNLLARSCYESEAEIAIISELFRIRNIGVWITDSTFGVAVWAGGRQAIQYAMSE